MVAQEYLKLLRPTCVFHTDETETKVFAGVLQLTVGKVCGQPAVAVYVSDDSQPQGRFVCQYHAEDAENNGDGPVFWQRPDPAR